MGLRLSERDVDALRPRRMEILYMSVHLANSSSLHTFGKYLLSVIALIFSFSCLADKKLERISTENELNYFTQTYYLHPQPELVPQAIIYLGRNKILTKYPSAERPMLAFFSKVFADNPSLAKDCKKLIKEQEPHARALLLKALDDSPEALVSETQDGSARNDMYWAMFFASGEYAYLNKLIEQLKYLNERKDMRLYLTAASAKWSLSSNARTDLKVRAAMEAMKVGDVLEMRPIAADILQKTPEQIREETIAILKTQKENGTWK